MSIKVKFTTVEPLLQIQGTRKDNGLDVITQKRAIRFINIGGEQKALSTPIFTSNGYRGMMRRIGTEIILDALDKKGLRLKGDTNFHLMNAGGGNNYQAQSFQVEKEVRELNPLVSVFGTSLAIRGKISVSDMIPLTHDEKGNAVNYYKINGESIYSNIIEVRTFIKKDDMLDRTGNARFMTEEELIEWETKASENQTARAKERAEKSDKGDKKEKKITIKHIQSREQVASGVDFYGSIEELMPLTDIERGMLVKIMEKISRRRIGSTISSGLGAVDYSIECYNGTKIIATRDEKYHADIKTTSNYDSDTAKCVKAFEDWLDEVSEKNVELDKILV